MSDLNAWDSRAGSRVNTDKVPILTHYARVAATNKAPDDSHHQN